ncbi:hypothetical protein GQ457_07G004320 [Hibiscus cannabinus]
MVNSFFSGFYRRWWLVGCAVVLWSLWLACNGTPFNGATLKFEDFFFIFGEVLSILLGKAGCGGVLRDGESQILALFFGSLGVLDSNVVELRAIVFALEMVASFPRVDVVLLVIESDSAIAISWVLHREWRLWRLRVWFRRLDSACLSLWCVCFNHVMRETNGVVDALAKAGVDQASWLCLRYGT